MSQDIKQGVLSHKLIRREEPEDLDAQVQALKELQKQPGFIARESTSKKDKGLFPTLREKWKRIVSLFSKNKY
ncbi:MAG: hypothetical protein PHU23_01565 [Dehalococcoidales bacterium]|nr:hypothetical protein [Dehalococcoidales bacterium]